MRKQVLSCRYPSKPSIPLRPWLPTNSGGISWQVGSSFDRSIGAVCGGSITGSGIRAASYMWWWLAELTLPAKNVLPLPLG